MNDSQPMPGQPLGFTPTVEGMLLMYQRLGLEIHGRIEDALLRQKTEKRADEIQEVATRILSQPRAAEESEPTPIEQAKVVKAGRGG